MSTAWQRNAKTANTALRRSAPGRGDQNSRWLFDRKNSWVEVHMLASEFHTLKAMDRRRGTDRCPNWRCQDPRCSTCDGAPSERAKQQGIETTRNDRMRRLMYATNAEFADLQERSVGRCIRLLAAEMPPRVFPRRAKVGIEGQRSGPMTMYVQKGCRTRGLPSHVQAWFDEGGLEFPTPDPMRQWLWTTLRPCYQRGHTHRALRHARIRAAMARLVAGFGVELSVVHGDVDVVVHIDLCIDVLALGDLALQNAIRALLGPQLDQLVATGKCAKIAIRLISGFLLAAPLFRLGNRGPNGRHLRERTNGPNSTG